MHKTCLLLLLLSWAFTGQARQLHTVNNGNWFDPSVWFNQLIPASTYDTVEVANNITVNAYIVLSQNAVLIIDSGASLCDIDTLEMYNNAQIYIYGYVAANFIYTQDNAYEEVVGPGFLNVGHGGMSLNGGAFKDSTGCVLIHAGNATCNLLCTIDSNVYLHYNGPLVTFEADTSAIPGSYQYVFGDGDYSGPTTWYQVHRYSDTGYYTATVILQPCCVADTLYVPVHVTSLVTTGLLPAGWCNAAQPIINSAMPAAGFLLLKHNFCNDTRGTITLYSLTGAVVYTTPFATTGTVLNETIPVSQLTTGCYILNLQTADGFYCTKVMVGNL